MRLIQHKREAYWFYRFLSVFYDHYVNPLFWTEYMRDESLSIAKLNADTLKVIDVGSGTGFTTQGIVKSVKAEFVTCLDQSPHQMQKATQKFDLQDCRFILGDAENLPFPQNTFDRYVSAGSIEYWPDPQKGISEALRVIRSGGIALIVGPLEPGSKIGRMIANSWMLFPTLEEYKTWFATAGFIHIEIKFIRPQWFQGKYEYGVAIAGEKPDDAILPVTSSLPANEKMSPARSIIMFFRVLVGSIAGFIFIPVALFGYLRNALSRKEKLPGQYMERLNRYQVSALIVICLLIGLIILLLIL